MKATRLSLVISAGLFMAITSMVSNALAGQVRLAWDANRERDLAGYKLYYGQASRDYRFNVDVGNQTTYMLSGLAAGQTYYVALRSYDTSGNQSDFSSEVSVTISAATKTGSSSTSSTDTTTGSSITTAPIIEAKPLGSAAEAAEYVIGADDVLFISLLENKELDTVARVNPGGKISFPLIGDVQAAGLTAEELADQLTRTLSKKIRNPVVTVSLREINSYRVYTLGSVARPGVVSSKSELTLLQALALAGGVSPGADLTLAYVARGNEKLGVDFRKLLMDGDLSQNVVLKPEDVVVIPANPLDSVFIMGEVKTPGPLPLDPEIQLTLLHALASAGGFGEFAKPSGTIIIREEGNGKRVIPADVDEIMENPQGAKDILLQPGDVVIVPQGGLF